MLEQLVEPSRAQNAFILVSLYFFCHLMSLLFFLFTTLLNQVFRPKNGIRTTKNFLAACHLGPPLSLSIHQTFRIMKRLPILGNSNNIMTTWTRTQMARFLDSCGDPVTSRLDKAADKTRTLLPGVATRSTTIMFPAGKRALK